MPRELFTEDGDKIEVPTEDELKALKEAQEKLKGQEGITKELEDANAKLADYEANPSEKNWKSMRKVNEELKKALKEQGKEVDVNDETGEVTVKTESNLSAEELTDLQRKVTREEIVGAEKSKLFGKYDEEKRKIVEHYFDKLSTGEEISLDNINGFISNAEKLAGVESAPSQKTINGQPPVFESKDGSFGDTEEGKKIANEVFGDDSYAKESK